MSRRVKMVLAIVVGAAVLVGVALLGVFLAARYEPGFYCEAMEVDPSVLEQGSDQMLQQAAALASAIKKDAHWESLITAEQINGWLAVDMVKNHPNALPSMLRDPRVAIDSKRITLACRFEQDGVNSVLSLTVEPYMPEPNVVALRIVKARAGLLPAPLNKVIDGVKRAARAMQLHLEWRHTNGDPVALLSFPPTDDEQPVCIETLRLGEGEIYLAGSKPAKESQEAGPK